MSQKGTLAQEIRLGSPDRFSSWEGGVWGWGLGTRLGKVYDARKNHSTVNTYEWNLILIRWQNAGICTAWLL